MLRVALLIALLKLSCGLHPQKTSTPTIGDPSCVIDWNGTLDQHFKFSDPDIQYNLTIIGSQRGVVTKTISSLYPRSPSFTKSPNFAPFLKSKTKWRQRSDLGLRMSAHQWLFQISMKLPLAKIE